MQCPIMVFYVFHIPVFGFCSMAYCYVHPTSTSFMIMKHQKDIRNSIELKMHLMWKDNETKILTGVSFIGTSMFVLVCGEFFLFLAERLGVAWAPLPILFFFTIFPKTLNAK